MLTTRNRMKVLGAGLVGAGVASFGLGWVALAELPASGDPAAVESREVSTVSGTLTEFRKNDRGDVDRFALQDGKEVQFPPHLAEKVSEAFEVGDDLKIRGREETRPRGERVFVAELIESGDVRLEIDLPRPPRHHGPGPKHQPGQEEPAMEATGVVVEMNANPHGDTDGFTLEGGTIVKFPPHQGDALLKIVTEGAQVEVVGRRHVTPDGEVHLQADRIRNATSGEEMECERPLPPPHHAGPHGGPHAGPLHGPHAGPHTARLQEEILGELRAIRRLLEDRQDG